MSTILSFCKHSDHGACCDLLVNDMPCCDDFSGCERFQERRCDYYRLKCVGIIIIAFLTYLAKKHYIHIEPHLTFLNTYNLCVDKYLTS